MPELSNAAWICLGLVVVAGYLHRHKIFGESAPVEPLRPRLVTATSTPAEPPAQAYQSLPPPPAHLAGLLHASVQAEATTRAVTRGVEFMIEDSAKRVVLPWAIPPAAPASAPVSPPNL